MARYILYGTWCILSNPLPRKTTLVVGDGDAVGFTSGFIGGGDVQDTIHIDIEGRAPSYTWISAPGWLSDQIL